MMIGSAYWGLRALLRRLPPAFVRRSGGSGAAVATLLAALLAAWLPAATPARAQEDDLGELYRRARVETVGRRLALQRLAPTRPELPRTPYLDSLRARFGASAPARGEAKPLVPLPPVRKRQAMRRLERPLFEQRFADTRWAYLGANSPAALDTMRTRALRARLQAHFGNPTVTVVDTDTLAGRPLNDYIQFEYWMVVNDTIPVKVMDTGGPFDRGLVFAAPARFRTRLRALRDALLAPLLETSLRARYVDYYFDTDAEVWYRAGFDGRRFFVNRVRTADVLPRQRPVLRRTP